MKFNEEVLALAVLYELEFKIYLKKNGFKSNYIGNVHMAEKLYPPH